MNILTRQEAIETCYPGLLPDQIAPFRLTHRNMSGEVLEVNEHWLPAEMYARYDAIDEMAPSFPSDTYQTDIHPLESGEIGE